MFGALSRNSVSISALVPALWREQREDGELAQALCLPLEFGYVGVLVRLRAFGP